MSSVHVLPARPPVFWPPTRAGRLHGWDLKWALAFVAPYALVFCAFVAYPFGYALWMVRDPAVFRDLVDDPIYLSTVVNTLLFVGLGVNMKMFLALLLSSFFLRPQRWIKMLLVAFILPWAIATAQACVSFHWMLTAHWGLVDGVLSALFGTDGLDWLGQRWPALGADIATYIWKWLPFWTMILIAGRLTVPRDIYDAAKVDGANPVRSFIHITWPLLANLYLVCTLISLLWTLGDFTTVYLVSSGGPADTTQVLATLGFEFAFEASKPALGVATVLSALPVLIPIVIILMRRLRASEAQL